MFLCLFGIELTMMTGLELVMVIFFVVAWRADLYANWSKQDELACQLARLYSTIPT
jgi:hypothetical protein